MAQIRHTLEEMREIALSHGGECQSQEYVNTKTRMKWRCSNGHNFESTPGKVLLGRWCPECGRERAAESRRIPFSEIELTAKVFNGKCLSNEYIPNTKLTWQCEFGHVFSSDLHSVRAGHWCPICGHQRSGRKKLLLDEFILIAQAQGGKCLSSTYKNCDEKLLWECAKGHTWKASGSSVKKGHWCPICAGMKRITLEDAQLLAEKRGGKCLSMKVDGSDRKLVWQCAEGHSWSATYSNIRFGRWCPECSAGLGERICRLFFENMFKKEFKKSRPTWLINDDGYQMELDGYNEELEIAFEHQGRQHNKMIPYYYSSVDQYTKRIADDQKKHELCKVHGITLITVPQIPDDLHLADIREFILQKCNEKRIEIPPFSDDESIDLQKAFSPDKRAILSEIQDAAENFGGQCLSSSYLSSKEKLTFKCREGHVWITLPSLVLKGHWCPTCGAGKRGYKRRLTIELMDRIAMERGGRCISTEYINANSHLTWECKKGHRWRAIPNSIKRGSWCPICANERKRKS